MELGTGRVVKVEALARWNHPERGSILPDRFIPLAERSGVIDKLGAWILRRACLDTVAFHAEGIDVDLTVNLSTVQLAIRTSHALSPTPLPTPVSLRLGSGSK